MRICDDNDHGEIVYSPGIYASKGCPACKRVEELEAELEKVREKAVRLQQDVEDIQIEVGRLEAASHDPLPPLLRGDEP